MGRNDRLTVVAIGLLATPQMLLRFRQDAIALKPAADFPWRPGLNPGPKIVALNEWLKSYSKSRHLIYVDYYKAMTDGALGIRSDLTPDGVHPSQAGYRVMEPLTTAAIRMALRR